MSPFSSLILNLKGVNIKYPGSEVLWNIHVKPCKHPTRDSETKSLVHSRHSMVDLSQVLQSHWPLRGLASRGVCNNIFFSWTMGKDCSFQTG